MRCSGLTSNLQFGGIYWPSTASLTLVLPVINVSKPAMEIQHTNKTTSRVTWGHMHKQYICSKAMHTPFPTHKLVFINTESVVRICAPHAFFRPDVHVFLKRCEGDVMRWRRNIRCQTESFRKKHCLFCLTTSWRSVKYQSKTHSQT